MAFATQTYRLNFTLNDAASTDPNELTFEIRTAADGLGNLLASGKATSGTPATIVVKDDYVIVGALNTRYLRTYDGAGNPFDTSFTFAGEEPPPPLAGAIISVAFVFEWRDHRYNLLADLTPAVQSAEVSLMNDRAVARTARFLMDEALFPAGFNPETDRVSIRARFAEKGQIKQYPLGHFALDFSRIEHHATGDPTVLDTEAIVTPTTLISALGADLCSHLEEAFFDESYTVDAGTNYITAAEAIFDTVTFVDFTGIARPMRREFDQTAQVTPAAITWPPGVSKLAAINDLMAGINFFGVWADGEAIFRTKERALPWDAPIDHTYTTLAEPRMIVSPLVREPRKGLNPNQILATVDDPARAVLTSARENSDAKSLIGTGRIGVNPFFVTRTTPHIVDAATQEDWADYELALASARADRAILQTGFDPRRQSREIYSLQIGGLENDSRWYVHGWSLSMEVGSLMLHALGRADELTFEDMSL